MIKPNKIYLLLLFLIAVNLSAQEYWDIIGEMKDPVSRAQAVVYNDRIYVIGGYSSELQEAVDWIQEYDPYTKTWSLVGKLTAKRQGAAAVVNNNEIYVFGGVEASGEKSQTLEKISPQNNFASSVISSHFNFDRTFASAVSINNSIFIFGGYSTSALGDKSAHITNPLPYITEYDIVHDTFLFKSDSLYTEGIMPSMQASAIVNDDVYIFGGVYSGIMQSISKFNITTKQFEQLEKKLLVPRAGGTALYNDKDDKIYIIGGYHELNPAMRSVEVLNTRNTFDGTTEWNSLNFGRKNPTAVFYSGNMFVFGGEDINGNNVKQIETYPSTAVSMVNEENAPINYNLLEQNYPNPFNPVTNIEYRVPQSVKGGMLNVKMIVYDVLGNEVAVLVNESKSPGTYNVSFEAENLPSGIYLYKLSAGNTTVTKKMMLIK